MWNEEVFLVVSRWFGRQRAFRPGLEMIRLVSGRLVKLTWKLTPLGILGGGYP